jgi:hypothetical protein
LWKKRVPSLPVRAICHPWIIFPSYPFCTCPINGRRAN